MPDPREVRSMFARISPRYDAVNRILSLGIDRGWRSALLDRAGDLRGRVAVDVCCGTGDVALLLARRGASVLGADFTPEMLRLARARRDAAGASAARAVFVHADAQRLPARDRSAHVCTVAFGIRNVADRAAALREMARVLEPGGRLLVLEFGLPRGRVSRALYRIYFERVLPRVGGLVSGDRAAYAYLPRSVSTWPGPVEFQREIEAAGLVDCGHAPLTGGVVWLHWGTSPRTSGDASG